VEIHHRCGLYKVAELAQQSRLADAARTVHEQDGDPRRVRFLVRFKDRPEEIELGRSADEMSATSRRQTLGTDFELISWLARFV
jgi:hypothetical protein